MAQRRTERCLVCGNAAVFVDRPNLSFRVECPRCGSYLVDRIVASDWKGTRQLTSPQVALVSHALRRLQDPSATPALSFEFVDKILNERSLPYPMEAGDLLISHLGTQLAGTISRYHRQSTLSLEATVGAITSEDVWEIIRHLTDVRLIDFRNNDSSECELRLTFKGWSRFQELRRVAVESHYAFFARKFDNKELDEVYKKCLQPAVSATGYDLRTVPQGIGLIDSKIENDIRNCRFVVADLSNANDGAYWEAGFAEGLGKPVFYVCKKGVVTHFDTNHRFTVFWDPHALDLAQAELKARIRNTLLADAKQTD